MELGPRDRLSQAFWHEERKGRTIQTPQGSAVNLDMRHLGEKKLRERLPQIYELALEFMGIDPAKSPVPVRPAVHYTMGGIPTNALTAAPLPGLYAVGECASVGIHGANRLGSNSLAELVVFGKVAGIEAAKFAQGVPPPVGPGLAHQAREARARAVAIRARPKGGERLAVVRDAMVLAMEKGCGIYRLGNEMQEACDMLTQLKSRAESISLSDTGEGWNTNGSTRSSSASSSTSRARWRTRRSSGASRAARTSASTGSPNVTTPST
jgi:fumarate reductase flavoprotein subunit